MHALARTLCVLVRWLCRALQFRRRRPPWPLKLALASLGLVLYSWFAPVLALLRGLGARLECETTTLFGASFRCDVTDIIQGYIYFFGIWEPDVTAYLQRTLRAGDTVVDVGANVGYDTLLAASLVGTEGRVVAIEASPSVHRRLTDNLTRNGPPKQVRTLLTAVAATPGTVTVYQGPPTNLGQTTTAAHLGRPAEAQVPAAPLVALLTKEEIAAARLIKIDVEGTEREIIAGLADDLHRFPADVEFVLELSPGLWPQPRPPVDEVLRPFLDGGFHVYRVPNSYWFWHALWPADAHRPRRIHGTIDPSAAQLDLVLSRRDEEQL
jgi:FkbM family methyltransferase